MARVAAPPRGVTRYLTVDQVIAIHDELVDAGPVLDLGTLTSEVMRPQFGFGGQDAHPTLMDKAAALLHGLASTQSFQDGNKRTAWLATLSFLLANGKRVQTLPDIEAEAFVAAVAVSAWNERTVGKAAEWLGGRCVDVNVGGGSYR